MVVYEPGSKSSPDTESDGTLILDFPSFRTVKNKFLLFTGHPIYGIFVIKPEQSKAGLNNIKFLKVNFE